MGGLVSSRAASSSSYDSSLKAREKKTGREKEKEKSSEKEEVRKDESRPDPSTAAPTPFKFAQMDKESKDELRIKILKLFRILNKDGTPNESHPQAHDEEFLDRLEFLMERCSDAKTLAEEFSLDYFRDRIDELQRKDVMGREAESAWDDVDLDTEGKYVIKLKLIVNETSYFQSMPVLFNKIIQSAVKMDYGIMHTGLLLGDKIVDWNDSSVAMPRSVTTFFPRLTIDLCNIDLEKDQEKIYKMCNKIVEWNTRQYSTMNANCQAFVNDVLGAMGVSIPAEGALGEALERLRKNGRLEMAYTGRDGQTVQFKNHEELDNFVHTLLADNQEFPTEFKYDWALLKAFDRAYWLMFYNRTDKQNREKLVLLGQPCEDGCPFGDPMDTGTLLG